MKHGFRRSFVNFFILGCLVCANAQMLRADTTHVPTDPQKNPTKARSMEFYAKGAKISTFDPDLQSTSAPKLSYLPGEGKTAKRLAQAPQKKGSPQEVSGSGNDIESRLASGEKLERDEIVKAFGDPQVPRPVLGNDEAPAPFRGMMVALESGDETLARAYAEQFVDYMERLEDRSARVSSIVSGVLATRETNAPKTTVVNTQADVGIPAQAAKPPTPPNLNIPLPPEKQAALQDLIEEGEL